MRITMLPAALAICLLAGGCIVVHNSQPTVAGSGKRATDTRALAPFREIEFRGAGQIEAKVGGAPSITLEIDDNLLDLITTEVHDGRLVISSSQPYRSTGGLTATIAAPELESICQRGAGNIRIDGVHGDRFAIELLGTGTIRASGTASRLTADLVGSGTLDLSDLTAREATVDLMGVGDVRVNATESLRASVFGSGNIHYRGNPKKVEKHVAGVGTVDAE